MNPKVNQTLQSSLRTRRLLALPAMLAALALFSVIIFYGHLEDIEGTNELVLITLGFLGIVYTLFLFLVVQRSKIVQTKFRWIIPLVNGLFLGLFDYILPSELDLAIYALIILVVIISVIEMHRLPAYMFIFCMLIFRLIKFDEYADVFSLVGYYGPFLLSIVLVEILASLQTSNQRIVGMLETINRFAREVTSTIETDEVISLINAAVQRTIPADTYYVAFVKSNDFVLSLFYDHGKYYDDVSIPVKGTLCGWILEHQQPLFIRDMLNENYTSVIIGEDKPSRSWMGVPIFSELKIIGVIAVASYKKHAFDEMDFELLENITQLASMALDNAKHHADVEQKSHLDSLTGVFNHAYFLESLENAVQNAHVGQEAISLIMLDIDFFKEYNDNFGHLVGDDVLQKLISAIRQNIKHKDIIGRWGGEEFAIALLNTGGKQATKVAVRISETVNSLVIPGRGGEDLPAPTVSQGIAVFPFEAGEIYKLIDIADQRLYEAKERGRNQIEPDRGYWDK